MRVLYVGVGPGSDALTAEETDAGVTAIDVSTKMIETVSRRFVAAGQDADLRCCDLLASEPEMSFDVIVLNLLVESVVRVRTETERGRRDVAVRSTVKSV